jgi:exodeoxyribonuclease V alpha subunit
MVLTSRVGLLGGYAGSGKTSVLRAVCDVAEAHGRVMYLMALSGKAARRITEATNRSASTIASFLKRAEERAISLGPETIIVVDEASMIDLTTLYRLLLRIGSGRLLLVGDPAQLPPIGFGNPFHTLIDHPSLPCVVLDRVLRQTAESGIPIVAAAIRNGRMPTLENFTGLGSGVSFIDCDIEQAVDMIGPSAGPSRLSAQSEPVTPGSTRSTTTSTISGHRAGIASPGGTSPRAIL